MAFQVVARAYRDCILLGCDALQSGKLVSQFVKKVLRIYQITWPHILEENPLRNGRAIEGV